jgi:hypothetical protein
MNLLQKRISGQVEVRDQQTLLAEENRGQYTPGELGHG